MTNELANKKPPFVVKQHKVGLAAKKQEARALDPTAPVSINPAEMPDRIGIVFDDSGSMAGSAISDAHAGIEEFLRSCKPQTTAIAVYPMNAPAYRLNNNLPNTAMLVKTIRATGGTPALDTLKRMINCENLTRAIMFSDGGYSDYIFEGVVAICKEKSIPVDTVFIGPDDSAQMQRLSEATGGIYLHFDGTKSNFRTAFKYLSPGFRAMLMDKSFADKIQGK